MGRTASGWRLRWKNGIAYVRFTHDKQPYEFSTQTGDPDEAAKRAAHRYAQVVSGRWRPLAITRHARLDEMIAAWLEDLEATHDETTVATYLQYARREFIPVFGELAAMLPAKIADWSRGRLRAVQRTTLLKERTALRSFLAWAVEKQFLAEVPSFPALPKRSMGVKAGVQRSAPVDVTAEQVSAFLAAVPERSARKGFIVRDRFAFMYETTLRPATIDAIEVPRHYHKGAAELLIEDEHDKARFGRSLPLTARAREILDRCAPEVGAVFGRHDYREYVKAAAKATGLPAHLAEDFAAYDLRHARATHLLEAGGALPAVSYVLGHRRMTTTNRYVRATKRAAEAMLKAVGETNLGPPQESTDPAGSERASAGPRREDSPSNSTGAATPGGFRFQWGNSCTGSTPVLRTEDDSQPQIQPQKPLGRAVTYLTLLRAQDDVFERLLAEESAS